MASSPRIWNYSLTFLVRSSMPDVGRTSICSGNRRRGTLCPYLKFRTPKTGAGIRGLDLEHRAHELPGRVNRPLSVFCPCSASDRSLEGRHRGPRNSILFGMSTALVDVSTVFFKHEDSGSGPALARRFLALREGSTEVNVR